ncbi:hypothetical protein BT63DRAFT_442401 [Microthyrium microscopicum]|uniref:ATP phosphoribosyltransferase n=1 Tax=Microthyrium microscopicum TaxID=703497 RepID=A0A6A6U2E5_9PEZI|nr:hypothetical protein BT63DRAFT_442401 [Microthyrium microscopicum]
MASAVSAIRYKLVYMVPASALAVTKAAIFSAGAGRFPGEQYTECAFTCVGKGQFRPGDQANPHIGKIGELEEVEEARVEIVCFSEDVVKPAVKALKKAHPYETPAYEVYKLEDF